MSHFAVLSTSFLGISYANGICARNIVQALRDLGEEVTVICYHKGEDAPEGVMTFQAPPKPQRRPWQTLCQGVQMALGIGTPPHRKPLVEQYFQKLCQLHTQKPIDCVVAMYFPPECAVAACQWKQAHPQTRVLLYELDSALDGVRISQMFYGESIRQRRFLNRLYQAADSIFVMQSHVAGWQKHFGSRFGNKLCVADIPVLVPKDHAEYRKTGDGLTLLYAGLIEKRYRSPAYLLQLLKRLAATQPFTHGNQLCFSSSNKHQKVI